MTERMYTPGELGERIRKSEKSLELWRAQGIGPAYVRVGRSILYRETDVETWLAANRVETRGLGRPA